MRAAALLLSLIAPAALAQVTLDAFASAASTTRTRYPLTVGAGANRQLVVFVHLGAKCADPAPTVISVTYAGQPLARAGFQPGVGCTGALSEIWSFPPGVQPLSGTNDVVVTLSAAPPAHRTIHSGAFSVTGVDPAANFSSLTTSDGVGTSATATLVTSGANDLVLESACSAASIVSTAQTLRWQRNSSTLYSCDNSGGATAVGGTTSLSWTVGNGHWAVAGVSVKAAAAMTVALDAYANSAGGDQLSYPLTVGSAANRALAVFTHKSASCGFPKPVVTGVTYAGVPLGLVHSKPLTACPESTSELWALPAGTQPAQGTNNVVVTLAGAMEADGSLNSGAISAAGVDQTTTFRAIASNDGYSASASVTLGPSAPEDLVIDSICNGSSLASTPQTERWRLNVSNRQPCGSSAGATADGGTTNLQWVGANDAWGIIAAAFRAASDAGSGGDAGQDAGAGSDAGADGGTDAGPGSDAGAFPDGGPADGGGPALQLDVGCGCSSAGGVAMLAALALVGLVLRRGRAL